MKIESKLDKEIDLKIDLTGSEGASFNGTFESVKTVHLKPRAFEEIAQVKLSGDWLLKIKFTYTVKNHDGSNMIPKSLLNSRDASDSLV